jgi:hypothetical protein
MQHLRPKRLHWVGPVPMPHLQPKRLPTLGPALECPSM